MAHSGWSILLSLFLSSFAGIQLQVLTSLFISSMGETFKTETGFMEQINTFSFVAAFLFSLLMGVLSVRLKHRLLLIFGMLAICISSLGCYMAPDLNTMFISYAISGIGAAMVSPMTIALVGDCFPLNKRVMGVGIVVAAGSAAYAIGAPTMALISSYGGWRLVLLVFVIPLTLAGLLLAVSALPSKTESDKSSEKANYAESFRGVLLNRSALFCLVSNVLRLAQFGAIVLFAAAFIQQRILDSTEASALVIVLAALAYTFGSVIASPLVNALGRKSSTIITTLLAAIFTMPYTYMSDLSNFSVMIFIASWFSGMAASAANSLTLEQTQEFRGTMMSLNSAAQNLGTGLAAGIGGLILLSYGFEFVSLTLGIMSIVAAILFRFLAVDPVRKNVKN